MAATEKRLSFLHQLQAEGFIRMLEADAQTGEDRIPLTAADRQAITAFLKNNDITCTRDIGSATAEVEAALERSRQRRNGLLLSDRELDDAIGDAVVN